ncbi:DpnI domain-containing protein [Aceticella autotrophica]|uniref:DpnI domain-containing protein n=1 Tax=Aceticella autotrophica TaxID=2755338 RepID=UPI0025437929|nr:DpnI domain-containing protein [Aceticella autotrophica]
MKIDGTLYNYYKKYSTLYKNKSQLIRVISENWFRDNMYCPFCTREKINAYNNNHPVADFFCDFCGEEFQLKSKKQKLSNIVVDGEYYKMMDAIYSNSVPNFLFMSYSSKFDSICDLLIIPKEFIVPGIIQKRKPLSNFARRSGWTGCNIILENIPDAGKVFAIKNRNVINMVEVRASIERIAFYREIKEIERRGWIIDILNVIARIKKEVFNLKDVYTYVPYLKSLHPNNNNIEAKIRQQLQILRDNGIIEFLGRGVYKKI